MGTLESVDHIVLMNIPPVLLFLILNLSKCESACNTMTTAYTTASFTNAWIVASDNDVNSGNSNYMCNQCICNLGRNCALGGNTFYPTCLGNGNVCKGQWDVTGMIWVGSTCSVCAPGASMVKWYTWKGMAKYTQTYPAAIPLSLPANCDTCNLWTWEYCLACSSGTFSSSGA